MRSNNLKLYLIFTAISFVMNFTGMMVSGLPLYYQCADHICNCFRDTFIIAAVDR